MSQRIVATLCGQLSLRICASVLIGAIPGVCYSQTTESGDVSAQAIVNAEEARAPEPADVQVLVKSTRSSSASIQVLAVRALGRLERVAVVPDILPSLASPIAEVRVEAANALGQALAQPGQHDPEVAVRPLRERLIIETDPAVRGVIYATLGRLPYSVEPDVREIEAVLIKGTAEGNKDPSLAACLGAVTGLESLFRQQVKKGMPAATSLERLRVIVKSVNKPSETAARVRRLSMAALIAGGGADAAIVRTALKDSDAQVRRLAAIAAGSNDALSRLSLVPAKDPISQGDRTGLITEALRDRDPMVRYDALQAYGAYLQKTSCQSILEAVKDPGPHVSLLAVDLLGKECPDSEKEKVAEVLVSLTKELPSGTGPKGQVTWHRPAHAFVSLSNISPQSAGQLLPVFVSHPSWEVRMYGARAAANLKDAATLEKLANDSDDNVRSAAITSLSRIEGHAGDKVYIAALQRSDHQVIRLAARALGGTPDKSAAVAALFSALDRLTQKKKDNTRDARVGILQTLKGIGDVNQADALKPYLTDFDPRVASIAADDLTAWTGLPVKASPIRAPAQVPNISEIEKLGSARVRIVMASGGIIEARMFPSDAPATVDRFVHLARAGYYNGLTFHRVVPNWVIQGGSPGANELAGDSPFMKDEVGLRPHVRGALGISTRGHDTGDAQIYVDLCDNFKLDHAYTVWGEVVKGMEVVDRVLEGDVISKIEITPTVGKGKSD